MASEAKTIHVTCSLQCRIFVAAVLLVGSCEVVLLIAFV